MIKILSLKLVTLLKHQIIKLFFAKGYVPNLSEEVFVIKKVKSTEEEFRDEKLIKRKDNELYVKWKGYHSCFMSVVDKK